jgi:phosphatidylglycerophosphatase A
MGNLRQSETTRVKKSFPSPVPGKSDAADALTKRSVDTKTDRTFGGKTAVFLGTVCYIGKIPFAPGTFGSLPGLLFAFYISGAPFPVAAGIVLAFVAVAIRISGKAEEALGRKDPPSVVIDETAGMTVSLLGLPLDFFSGAAGFILFRALDILKPWPIRKFERIPGGSGIVFDDLIAGVMTNLILRFLL